MPIPDNIKAEIQKEISRNVSHSDDGAYVMMGVEYAYHYFKIDEKIEYIKRLEAFVEGSTYKLP